jgi:Hemerythrin HHE cation binding domain
LIQIKAAELCLPQCGELEHAKKLYGNEPGMETEHVIAEQFRRMLATQTELCLELERIADSLPGPLDGHACLDLAQRMLPMIKRAHEFEESKVWPLLTKDRNTFSDLRETLDRLSFEHWGDEDFAEQVFHLLRDYVREPTKDKVECLAWTLRGFFQNMERHIAFEREHLLPMILREAMP